MSFTYTGFVKDDLETIITKIAARAYNVIPNMTLEPSNPMYQWMKIVALEELYMQSLVEQAVANMTVMGAAGVFLEYHGREAGVFKKTGTEAYGTVQCYISEPNNKPIPIGSTFSTSDSINFYSYETVGFYTGISMTRGATEYDYIPSQYNTINVEGLYYETEHLTPASGITGSAWTYASGRITWIDTGLISYGSQYAIWATGEMIINVPIVAQYFGTASNVGADTIIVKDNGIEADTCTNEEAILNGTDDETDDAYRYRIISAGRKGFTLQDIQDITNEVAGVEECKVYQNYSADKSSTTDWTMSLSQTTGLMYERILSGTTYGFSFHPSSGIGTLRGIILNGRMTGNAPELYFQLKLYISGVYNTGTTGVITSTYLDRGVFAAQGEEVWQDIYVPIRWNGIDQYSTYRVYIWTSGSADTGNCWCLTTSGLSISSYRDDHFSGSVSLATSGFMYKTLYGVPGYTISVVPVEGYIFDDIKPEIEALLDPEGEIGYSPVGIQCTVVEATKLYMGLSVTLFLKEDYIFSEVSDAVKANVSAYLRDLHPGDDIFYSQIERVILNTDGVEKDRGLKICLNTGAWYDNTTEADLQISENEYAVLDIDGEVTTVTIIEG